MLDASLDARFVATNPGPFAASVANLGPFVVCRAHPPCCRCSVSFPCACPPTVTVLLCPSNDIEGEREAAEHWQCTWHRMAM